LSGRRRHIAFADAEDDRRVDRLRDRHRIAEGI
jgi:hypothetical protein